MNKKEKSIIGCACIMALLACKGPTKNLHDAVGTDKTLTDENVINDMVDIDEIVTIEAVVENPKFMDAEGDTAWRRVNDKMIRVKIGTKYYLRKETKEGTVTDITYRYD